MQVIHLARSPLLGAVSVNVLKHGTGGLHIDRCRVGTVGGTRREGKATKPSNAGWENMVGHKIAELNAGRWPANLMPSHRYGCRPVGVKLVKAPNVGSGKLWSHYRDDKLEDARPADSTLGGEDGMEPVDVWECEDGCPVKDIDVQGGASRFFNQVQEDDMTTIPQELVDYLITLISPPDEKALYVESIEAIDFASHKDASVCGLLVRGQPTEAQSKELLRILKPGAHLLLIAPDEEPTGHTGACRIEDAGFEIRDAILWVREPGYMHYVAKASRGERELGCDGLEGKTGAEAVGLEEDAAGLNSPRAGAGRTAERVKNFHPTVKPIDLMQRLLQDVPKDKGPVLDPFMGSGTTGLACLRTGHDFVGIEREKEYLEIADARHRHHDLLTVNTPNPPVVVIKSDIEPKEEKKDDSVSGLFGFED